METRETAAKSDENQINGIRRVNLRAEIDTSPPFESVKEAVTRFGGSGPWLPLYRLGEAFNNFEDFDLKKVEEQAAELEKDLIVKELETLDVLEELGTTKRIVEDLKQQLQKEALKLSATPDLHSYEHVGAPVVKEMNKESNGNRVNDEDKMLQMQSPDMILMELKQAKVNLGNTMNELEAIQLSVESLNKKMKKEKAYLERTREKLVSKFAAMSAQEKAQEQARLNPPPSPKVEFTFDIPANMRDFVCDSEQHNAMVETRKAEVSKPLSLYEEHEFSVKTAEMRWLAAKKMEEAAKAAEAIALAEIKALSGVERSYEFALPEPRKVTFALAENSPLNPGAMMIPEEFNLKKVIDSKFQIDETNISKLTILKKLEEASEEILHSKQVLNDALNRIEIANKKQHAAKEALRKWIPEVDLKEKPVYNSFNFNNFNQAGIRHDSSLPDLTRSTIASNNLKRVSRPTTSMRDVLSRKQVPEGYAARKEMDEHTERRKVALSQMLQALREDLTLSPEPEKDHRSDQKQSATPRKKFGFIHISLPMSTFRDFQLAPTLEEFALIMGYSLDKGNPFRGIGQFPTPQRIDKVLKVDISKMEKKGTPDGFSFSRKYLEKQAQDLLKENQWDAFIDLLALIIYGIVLFPHRENIVDSPAIGVFLAYKQHNENPVPAVLADVYYSIHVRHQKRKGLVLCCLPVLYTWFISHMDSSFVEPKTRNTWNESLGNLNADSILWCSQEQRVEEVIYSCGQFRNVPLIGTKGCINYNPALALRQLGYPIVGKPADVLLKDFILHDMGKEDPEMLQKISQAWKKIHRKGQELIYTSYGVKDTYSQWVKDRVKEIIPWPWVRTSEVVEETPVQSVNINDEVEKLKESSLKAEEEIKNLQEELKRVRQAYEAAQSENEISLERANKRAKVEEECKIKIQHNLQASNGQLKNLLKVSKIAEMNMQRELEDLKEHLKKVTADYESQVKYERQQNEEMQGILTEYQDALRKAVEDLSEHKQFIADLLNIKREFPTP